MLPIDAISPLAERAAASQGCDVVLLREVVENGRRILRVLIERRGADYSSGSGVDLATCAAVSRALDADIEARLDIPGAFVLEVSSAGVERPLVAIEDCVRFSGRKVKVRTREAVDGRRTFVGVLEGAEGDVLCLRAASDPDAPRWEIPWSKVAKAHLVFEMNLP